MLKFHIHVKRPHEVGHHGVIHVAPRFRHVLNPEGHSGDATGRRTRTNSCAESLDWDVEVWEMRWSGSWLGGRLTQESEIRQRGEEDKEVEGRRRQVWKGKRLRLE